METHLGYDALGPDGPIAVALMRVMPTQKGDPMSTSPAPGVYATSNIEELRLALQALGNAYASQVDLLKEQVASEVERRRQSEQERERLRTEVEQLRRIDLERQRQEHEADRGELMRFRERREDEARQEAERLRNQVRDLGAKVSMLEKERQDREKQEKERLEKEEKQKREAAARGHRWFA